MRITLVRTGLRVGKALQWSDTGQRMTFGKKNKVGRKPAATVNRTVMHNVPE